MGGSARDSEDSNECLAREYFHLYDKELSPIPLSQTRPYTPNTATFTMQEGRTTSGLPGPLRISGSCI